MQIEIAIIGFNRSMSKTWPLIQKNLIKPLASKHHKLILNGVISFSEEIIVSDWSKESGFGEYNVPDSDVYQNLLEFDQKEIDIQVKEVFKVLQDHKMFNSDVAENNQTAALLNLLRYLYLQSKYLKLVNSETDLIIFIRPDLMPIDKFYFKNYLNEIDTILTPNWGKYGGHNDRFAIVPPALAALYFNRFALLNEYIKSHKALQAEQFLKWSLRTSPPKEIVIERMLRVRAGGFINKREDFHIPRKYSSNSSYPISLIQEFLIKTINFKRRYITKPFFKFDLITIIFKSIQVVDQRCFKLINREIGRMARRISFYLRFLLSSLFNKLESMYTTSTMCSFVNSIKTTYINLESRVDRDIHIKRELMRMGFLNSERFPAVSNENGAIGCTQSHLSVVQNAIEKRSEYIFVFEDDAQFICTKRGLQNTILEFMNNSALDVLCIGNNVLDNPKKISQRLSRTQNTQTASCYLMKASAFQDFAEVLEDGLEIMRNGDFRNGAVDIVWKRIQSTRVFVIPNRKLLIQKKSYSDITNTIVEHLT